LFVLAAVTFSPPAVARVVLPGGIFLPCSLEPTMICLASTFSRATGSANKPSNVSLGIFSNALFVGANTVNVASGEAAVAAKLVKPRAVNSVENSGVLPIRLATVLSSVAWCALAAGC